MSGVTRENTVDTGHIGDDLQRLTDRAVRLHDSLAEIGEVLVASTQTRFHQGVAPDGSQQASPRR